MIDIHFKYEYANTKVSKYLEILVIMCTLNVRDIQTNVRITRKNKERDWIGLKLVNRKERVFMKKRSIVLLSAIGVMGLMLTGCNEAKERVNAEGESVITIWSPSDEPAIEQWWVDKIAEFNAAHEGSIELKREAIVRADSYAYEDKINAAITSNDLPDILYVDGPTVSVYAANDIIQPLDDMFTQEDWDDFLDSNKQQGTYNGKIYAIGATESSVALFYNKDMLDSIGVTAPDKLEDAWTWAEFKEIAKALTKDGVVGTNIIMDKGEGLPYVLEQFWISNGTDFVSEDGSTAEGYVNSPEGVEAAAFLNSIIQEGYANIDPIQKEFHNGKAATMLGGSWEVATLENDYPDLNWGVTYLWPYFPVLLQVADLNIQLVLFCIWSLDVPWYFI